MQLLQLSSGIKQKRYKLKRAKKNVAASEKVGSVEDEKRFSID